MTMQDKNKIEYNGIEVDNPEEIDNRTTEEKLKDTFKKLSPYINVLWQKKTKIILINFLIAVVIALYLLLLVDNYYQSSTTILPEYGSKSSSYSGLSELASMAGVNVGEAAPTEIYQNLINSETVIEPVVYHKYKTEEYDKPVTLIEYFKIEADEDLPPEESERKKFLTMYRALTEGRISTDTDRMTKILNITVKMPESKLSADVVNQLVNSLDNYIRTKRKSYATEQRYYLEERIAQVKDSLTFMEEKLTDFREQNRMISQSPQLLLEQARLSRQVSILETVYSELTKQLELVKIDEIKDMPVLNVKEDAKDPIKKAGPSRSKTLVIVMFFIFLGTLFWYAFSPKLKEYYSIAKEETGIFKKKEKGKS